MSGISTVPPANPAANGPEPHFRFQFGPFQFHSELDIPELHGITGAGAIQVQIRAGDVPASIDGVSLDAFCRVARREYLLNIPRVARFYVGRGNEVRIEVAPNAPAPDISTFLLGSVFGALCHQNGLLPLHASAVLAGGRVSAFLGNSGAGKSTLAACLQERGYGIVSDDICVLEDGANVVPVAGWLKLWRRSLEHIGETPDERNRVYSADDKYRLYLAGDAAHRPQLANVIVLARGGEARIEPLTAPETIAAMMELVYLGYIPHLTGGQAMTFLQCAKALENAKGYRLIVPWGFDRMEEVLDLLESTVLSATELR